MPRLVPAVPVLDGVAAAVGEAVAAVSDVVVDQFGPSVDCQDRESGGKAFFNAQGTSVVDGVGLVIEAAGTDELRVVVQ